MIRRIGMAMLAPAIAIVFSLAVASLALILVDVNPLDAFRLMWDFASTSTSVASIINRSIPLYVSAVAVAIGFKMGLFNIGVEGQYLIAAMFAAWIGAQFTFWGPLQTIVIIMVAMAVGAVWAGIAGYLKITRGVNEVVSTIMLNFIAFSVIGFVLGEIIIGGDSLIQSTPLLPESAMIPGLNWIFTLLGFSEPRGTELQGFLIVAILLGVAYRFLVWKTRFGFELRASGMNPTAARMAGVNPKRMVLYTMLLSGGVAGLVGLSTMLGKLGAFTQDFPRQFGFTGIAVALLGRNNAVGMALGALLFGFMDRSALILDLNDIPKEIVQIIQGVIVLSVVIAYEIVNRWRQNREVTAASDATSDLAVEAEGVAA